MPMTIRRGQPTLYLVLVLFVLGCFGSFVCFRLADVQRAGHHYPAESIKPECGIASIDADGSSAPPPSDSIPGVAREDMALGRKWICAPGLSAHLTVRVIDDRVRTPLEHVRICIAAKQGGLPQSIELSNSSLGSLEQSPLTNNRGIAEFGLPAQVDLDLWADGTLARAGSAEMTIRALSENEDREVQVELPTGNQLLFFGRAIDRDTSLPVEGARWSLVGEEGSLSESEQASGTSSTRGGKTSLADD